ncbi:hypothetical protein EMPS_03478 [Entomortierella parvispora]|uniref:SCP domain-containing protein n=1 Tax=Entomortierella parvispora TaxID=205924 RepID=A0A9P3H7B7_9FUNG|nr:hypothetical protein EMPS_03478 [Entomortierella parvispora]
MKTYSYQCLFALILITLSLVTRGVTGRPLPVLEQTGVDGIAASPSPQSLAVLPDSTNTSGMDAPKTESLISSPSPRVEDTVATMADDLQATPKTSNNIDITQGNAPAGPVVESATTPVTTDEQPAKAPEDSNPKVDSNAAAVEKEDATTTTTTPEGSQSQAIEGTKDETALTQSPSPPTESLAAVPVKEDKANSPAPENKGESPAATSTPDAEKAKSLALEKATADTSPNGQEDATAETSHVNAHSANPPESILSPAVEDVESASPKTDAPTAEAPKEVDVATPETVVDPKSEDHKDPVTEVTAPTTPTDTAPAGTEGKSKQSANVEDVVDPKPEDHKDPVTEVTAPTTTTDTTPAGTEGKSMQGANVEDHEASKTFPSPAEELKDHDKVKATAGFDPTPNNLNGEATKPSGAAVDNNPSDSLKNTILPLINKKRAQHHSSPLTWNATLARMSAKRLQNQCMMPYSQERDRRGVTYALITNVDKVAGPDISQAVSNWYDEGSFFNYNNPTRSSVYQYFVQMVWRGTTQIGCATRACNDKDNSVGLFCIWDPAGNAVVENIPLKPDGTPEKVDINKKMRKNVRPPIPPPSSN